MASWAVVATCDEPVPLVAAFVAHHLAQGAAEVRIYLDRPDPAAEALLAGRPGVHLTLCDAAYWAARGRRRPASHVQRQMVNANHAATQVRADWLLHCDADEFLSAPLDGVLASIAPEVQVIGLSAVERCWLAGAPPAHVFDGVFRGPLPKLGEGPEQVYGPDAAFMTRGVLAYVGCKSLTRVGSGLFVSIHDAFRRGPGGGPRRTAPVVRARPWAPPGILHFDGLTRLHWVLKLTRYAQVPQKGRAAMLGPARSRQVEFVRAHRDAPGAAAALHDRLRLLSPAAAERLRGLGGLNEAGFDPRAAVAAMFPDHRFDFSEAGFDRRIRRRHPKLTAAM